MKAEELSAFINDQDQSPDDPCYEQDFQCFPLDVFLKLPSRILVTQRLHLQGSTDSTVPRQMTLDFLHFFHQTPVRITLISPQTNSRKEFNEQVWEVFLTYDVDQLQEFSLRNLPVDSFTSAAPRSPHSLKRK